MDELSIKVTIAKRQYPLKIRREDEDRVRKAEKLLNDRIAEFEQQYAVSDKLDILTMCAMQFASEFVNMTEDNNQDHSKISDTVSSIDNLISSCLKTNSVH